MLISVAAILFFINSPPTTVPSPVVWNHVDVVITTNNTTSVYTYFFVEDNTTPLTVLNYLHDQHGVSYTIVDGELYELNGVANSRSMVWHIYHEGEHITPSTPIPPDAVLSFVYEPRVEV